MEPLELDRWHMRRALELAMLGQGHVEPNPMVGCVIAQGAEIIGEGWHRRFGEAHAEVEALRIAGERARAATMFVTLEPCCHHAKTPPCTKAILAAGIGRVVAAQQDPFPAVDGGGLAELSAAGVAVEVGLLEDEARAVNAPYLKLLSTGRPWVVAKWAMTLDGKIATRTGASHWISGESSRRLVHELRGRVDAIMIGRQTARMDNPLLTARPPGPRTALRVVVDTRASLASTSQLVGTAGEAPLLVAVGDASPPSERRRLEQAGCEVFVCRSDSHAGRLDQLLAELGRRQMTNVLVEGGGHLLGALFDMAAIDEVHVYVAPKVLGGEIARSPVEGEGVAEIARAFELDYPQWQQVGDDLYVSGRIQRAQGSASPPRAVP
jgi:diaminohydroxyphosphoribosylaminopyrimidine deaminase / 5-amino-6-(5-phosphoribosylamino)uracil reductase